LADAPAYTVVKTFGDPDNIYHGNTRLSEIYALRAASMALHKAEKWQY